jgi:hypothetical protein
VAAEANGRERSRRAPAVARRAKGAAIVNAFVDSTSLAMAKSGEVLVIERRQREYPVVEQA